MQFLPNENGDTGRSGGIFHFAGYNQWATTSVAHGFYTGGPSGQRSLELLQNGQVRIGVRVPTAHADYKLSVDGKLVAQSLFVTNPSNWADFVFAPAYRLRPLPEVAAYIQQNQHLPDVPSAAEVLRDGYDLNRMDATLLQKIEELTLYVVQLQQKITALETKAAAVPATR